MCNLPLKSSVMKKQLLLVAAGFICFPILLQAQVKWRQERSLFFVNAGLSLPILCYHGDDVNNRDDGFAKAGFRLDVSYGYRFTREAGISAMLFWANNKAGNNVMKAEKGNYSYYGLLVGPQLTLPFSGSWSTDFRFLAGIAGVQTPLLRQGTNTWLNEHSVSSFAWGGGMALRYQLNGNSWLRFEAGHINMKPQFSLPAGDASKGEQHIVDVNFNAGIGWRF